MMPIWFRRPSELVARGRYFWMRGQYRLSAQEFWLAAWVARSVEDETTLLEAAWQAHERAAGRVSELEAPQ